MARKSVRYLGNAGLLENRDHVDGSGIDRMLSEWILGLNGAMVGLPPDTKLIDLPKWKSAPVKVHRRPSWCPNSQTEVELTICDDAQLSFLDMEYVDLFASVRERNAEAARQIARLVMNERNGCGNDKSCIAIAYRRAIDRLQRI
jgi:hypothetical protein